MSPDELKRLIKNDDYSSKWEEELTDHTADDLKLLEGNIYNLVNAALDYIYRKEAYGFFFEFIRTNVQINVQINTELTEAERIIFNLIQNNEGISKAEMAIRIGKSEKTVQRLISSLMKKQVVEREGSNKSGSWKI